MAICEYCNKEHDGLYGSGRFCSKTCASKFSNAYVSEDGRSNQIAALKSNQQKALECRTRKTKENTRLFRKNSISIIKDNNTGLIGKLGEVSTIKKFIEHDIPVYNPVLDNTKVDLIAEFGGKLQKIQVKTSSRIVGVDNGATAFPLYASGNIFDHGKATPKKTPYRIDEVDYFALYDCIQDDVYLIKNDGIRTNINIRHTKPLTNQVKNITYASDYQIDRALPLLQQGVNPEDLYLVDPFIYDKK